MVQLGNELSAIYEELRRGRMSRREFVVRAAALGIGAPLTLALANSLTAGEGEAYNAPTERPAFGTQEQVRGSGGELRVREWFAPDGAVAHLSSFPPSGARVSSLILEPLLSYGFDGTLLPTLVTKVPTKENGGLSEDLTRVTLELRNDVVWSDGEPLTADDVIWTWQWVTDETNQTTTWWVWEPIQSIEAIGPKTVELYYAEPNVTWFAPIAGAYSGAIIPSHLWMDGSLEAVNAQFATKPIGTGPYKVETFVPGDYVVCSINERYREPNKPYFETIRFQGGGDGASAAQAVLQDGDWDVAGTLPMRPSVLREMELAGGKGSVRTGLHAIVERIEFNFSDPNRDVEGERSSLRAPHPFLTDRAVRQAMALAIDRDAIARDVFGAVDLVPPVRNILTGIPPLESPNTSYAFDLEAANRLLDEAGWNREGDTRVKDGIELAVSFYTSVSASNDDFKWYRQEIQAAIKVGWEAIGIKVQLGRLPGDEFFDTKPENLLSYAHFYRDIQMFASAPESPTPRYFFESWYAGPNQSNVAQKANDWQGINLQRYVNPEFDALYDKAASTTDPARAAELFIQMNDLIVGDFVLVPLVAWGDYPFALSNRIAVENVAPSIWEPLFWNIANWRTVDDRAAMSTASNFANRA
jgi:peptide/nickel transport system substrate-binding protein